MDKDILNKKVEYSPEKIKKVLSNLYKNLDYNRRTLEEAVRMDDEDGDTVSLDKIKECVKKYLDYQYVLKEDDVRSQRIDGVGCIALVYDGRPEIMVEMAIKALCTHNNIVLFPRHTMATTKCIFTLFNKSLKEQRYDASIQEDEEEELYSNQNLFDLAVFIGDKYEYGKFRQRFKKDIVYNSFGSIQIYSDDEYFDDQLDRIDKYVYENNYVSFFYNDENIEDAIEKINSIAITDTVAIFTRDSKKATDFLKRIKATKVYINQYPFENYEFKFDETKLLLNKQIIA